MAEDSTAQYDVIVIGSGATGFQCITALTGVASQLTIFQHSANFVREKIR